MMSTGGSADAEELVPSSSIFSMLIPKTWGSEDKLIGYIVQFTGNGS